MKKIEMDAESLKRVIALIFPEGKLIINNSLELLSLSHLTNMILGTAVKCTTIDAVFNAFYALHYPMSVVEPLRKNETLQPYIITNSKAIYIAVELGKIKMLKRFLKFLNKPGLTLPGEFKSLQLILENFKTDNDTRLTKERLL